MVHGPVSSTQSTQWEEFALQRAAYCAKQARIIVSSTGLVTDVAKLCCDFLQSFPELLVMTVGRPVAWLDQGKLLLTVCQRWDVQVQCMVCKTILPAALAPKRISAPKQEEEEEKTKASKTWTHLVCCPDCLKMASHEDANLYYCNGCNYMCVLPGSPENAVYGECCEGRTAHNFNRCSLSVR